MKIGLLSMRLAGHLHPMTALGRKMKARRHEVTFFGLPDARASSMMQEGAELDH